MPLSPEEREILLARFELVTREVAKLSAGKAEPDRSLSNLERWYLKELDEIEFALGDDGI